MLWGVLLVDNMFMGYQYNAKRRPRHQCHDNIYWSHFSCRGKHFNCCLLVVLTVHWLTHVPLLLGSVLNTVKISSVIRMTLDISRQHV